MKSVSWATKNEVIGRLRLSGLSMKDFAIEEGYEPNTVQKVVSRYAGSRKQPRGAKSCAILEKLLERILDTDGDTPGDADGPKAA